MWSAFLQPLAPGRLEFSPDASLELSFSHAVDTAFLAENLRLEPPTPGAAIQLAPCRFSSSRCVSFSLSTQSSSIPARSPAADLVATAPIQPGAVHRLILPAGSSYHNTCGPSVRDLSVTLTGLVPFSVPFTQSDPPANTWDTTHPAARRHRLLLRHGLSPTTSVSALSDLLTVRNNATGDSLPHKLTRPAAALLLLETPLEPSTKYTISVAGSPDVTDGFGLPLRSSHSTFTTAAVEPKLLLPGSEDVSGHKFGDVPPIHFPAAALPASSSPASAPTKRSRDPLTPPVSWPALVYGRTVACRVSGLNAATPFQRDTSNKDASPRDGCGAGHAVEARATRVPPSSHRALLAALTSPSRDNRAPHFVEDGLANTAEDGVFISAFPPPTGGDSPRCARRRWGMRSALEEGTRG